MSTVTFPDTFEYVRKLVAERAAIVLEPSKTYLVDSRLGPVAQQNGFASVGDMVSQLQRQPYGKLHELVVEALTTNETSFFRDISPFEALRKTILPDLIQKRATQQQLSIWSAACSSGQELYSIALTIRHHFPAIASWRINLLGTDLSNQMVERARSGMFNQAEVNRGLPAQYLVSNFERAGLQWKLKNEIREMTKWHQLNLISTWTNIPQMDVIFLRNVLIYFSPETKRAILAQVRKVLRNDGYLFLGGAETTMSLDDNFERFPCDGAVCYRLKA